MKYIAEERQTAPGKFTDEILKEKLNSVLLDALGIYKQSVSLASTDPSKNIQTPKI